MPYLVHLRVVSAEPFFTESIHMILEFHDVFPIDFPNMHAPDRDIDLESGTCPICIPSYRMAPIKLRELKTQLQDLFDKRFILSS